MKLTPLDDMEITEREEAEAAVRLAMRMIGADFSGKKESAPTKKGKAKAGGFKLTPLEQPAKAVAKKPSGYVPVEKRQDPTGLQKLATRLREQRKTTGDTPHELEDWSWALGEPVGTYEGVPVSAKEPLTSRLIHGGARAGALTHIMSPYILAGEAGAGLGAVALPFLAEPSAAKGMASDIWKSARHFPSEVVRDPVGTLFNLSIGAGLTVGGAAAVKRGAAAVKRARAPAPVKAPVSRPALPAPKTAIPPTAGTPLSPKQLKQAFRAVAESAGLEVAPDSTFAVRRSPKGEVLDTIHVEEWARAQGYVKQPVRLRPAAGNRADYPDLAAKYGKPAGTPEFRPSGPSELLSPRPEPSFGSGNRFFTHDKFRESMNAIGEVGGLTAGVDPAKFYHLARVGGYFLEGGLREFGAWSKAMTDQFGPSVGQHLDALWKHINAEMAQTAARYEAAAMATQAAGAGGKSLEPPRPPTSAPPGGEPPVPKAYPPTHAANMNLRQFNLPEELAAEFKTALEADLAGIEQWRRGTITWAEDQARADAIDLSPKQVRRLFKLGPGRAVTSEHVFAAKDALLSYYLRADQAKRDYNVLGTPDARLARLLALEESGMMNNIAEGRAAEAGRSLNAQKGLARVREQIAGMTMSEKDRVLNKITDDLPTKNRKELESLLEEFDQIPEGDTVQLAAFMRKWSTKWKPQHWLNTLQKNDLLLNPTGRAGDLFSTGLWNAYLQLINRPVATAMENVGARVAGRPAETSMSGYFPALWAAIRGHRVGADNALHIMKSGMSRADVTNPDFVMRRESWGPLKYGGRMAQAVDAVNRGSLEGGERMFNAHSQATKEGLTGEAYGARVRELVEKPTPEMLAAEKEFGDYGTFMQSDRVIKGLHRFLDVFEIPSSVPVVGGANPAKMILPFTQFAHNLLRRNLDMTPAGVLQYFTPEIRSNPKVAYRLAANMAIGSASMAGFVWAALNGKINGAFPATFPGDVEKRRLMYLEGKKPYTVQIGDQWVSYRFVAAPFMALMAEAAAIADALKEGDATPEKAENLVTRMLATVGRTTLDLTALQGLRDLDNAIASPNTMSNRWAASFLGGFVPGSGALRKAAAIIDPKIRQADTVIERLQSGVPGLSRLLPARVDVLGKEIERTPTGLAALSPYPASPEFQDPVVKELVRLDVVPPQVKRSWTIGERTWRLSKKDYHQAQKDIGRAAYEQVMALLSEQVYTRMSKENQQDLVKDAISAAEKQVRDAYKVRWILAQPTD